MHTGTEIIDIAAAASKAGEVIKREHTCTNCQYIYRPDTTFECLNCKNGSAWEPIREYDLARAVLIESEARRIRKATRECPNCLVREECANWKSDTDVLLCCDDNFEDWCVTEATSRLFGGGAEGGEIKTNE